MFQRFLRPCNNLPVLDPANKKSMSGELDIQRTVTTVKLFSPLCIVVRPY